MNLRAFQNVGHDLFLAGLNNSHSGNMSTKNNRVMAITRSGAMLHRLEFGDIVETLIDGYDSQSEIASREKPVHRSIYLNTGAMAIVHAHPPSLIALSLHYPCIRPIDAEGAYFFADGAPVIALESVIASEEVAAGVVPLLARSNIVVVRGHGTFAIGKDLEEAYHWTSSLEHSAGIILKNNQF